MNSLFDKIIKFFGFGNNDIQKTKTEKIIEEIKNELKQNYPKIISDIEFEIFSPEERGVTGQFNANYFNDIELNLNKEFVERVNKDKENIYRREN